MSIKFSVEVPKCIEQWAQVAVNCKEDVILRKSSDGGVSSSQPIKPESKLMGDLIQVFLPLYFYFYFYLF